MKFDLYIVIMHFRVQLSSLNLFYFAVFFHKYNMGLWGLLESYLINIYIVSSVIKIVKSFFKVGENKRFYLIIK